MAVRKAEWQNNYIAKKYDRINLTVDKGRKDIIKAHADHHSESLNGFINRAITETMERDSRMETDTPERAIVADMFSGDPATREKAMHEAADLIAEQRREIMRFKMTQAADID